MGRVKRLGESVLKAGGAAGVMLVSALLWLGSSTSASYTTQGGWNNGWPGSNGTTTATYMLLDYSQGFRRRGMLGALVRMVVPAEEVRIWMGWAVWVALYLLAAIAASVVAQKLVRRSPARGVALIAVLASPYGFGHLASDTSFSGPLTIGLAVLVLVLASSRTRALVAISSILVFSVLLHEQTILFVGPVALAALAGRNLAVVKRFLVVIPGMLAFGAVYVLGKETGAQAMIGAGNFRYEESIGYFLDRNGSFAYVFRANEWWYGIAGYTSAVIGSGIVILALLCIIAVHAGGAKAPYLELGMLAFGATALCIIAVDWPRFWCLVLMMATLLLAVERSDSQERNIAWLRRAAGAGAVAIGVLSVVSVHYMDSAVGAYPLNNQIGVKTPYRVGQEPGERVSRPPETIPGSEISGSGVRGTEK